MQRSQSRAGCVSLAVAKGEEVRGSLGGSAGGKRLFLSLPTPPRGSPCAGLPVGIRLCCSRASWVAVPSCSSEVPPGLPRLGFPLNLAPKHLRSAFSTCTPGTGRALAWSRFRAPAGRWTAGGAVGPGAVVFRRREGHCLEGQRHPRPRADSSRTSQHLHVNLLPLRKGNR